MIILMDVTISISNTMFFTSEEKDIIIIQDLLQDQPSPFQK